MSNDDLRERVIHALIESPMHDHVDIEPDHISRTTDALMPLVAQAWDQGWDAARETPLTAAMWSAAEQSAIHAATPNPYRTTSREDRPMTPDDLHDRITGVLHQQGWTCEYHEPYADCSQCQPLWRSTADAVIDVIPDPASEAARTWLATELLTDPAVEAAAQSLHATHAHDDWDDEYEEDREQYRQDAHDAIQAAIEAVT